MTVPACHDWYLVVAIGDTTDGDDDVAVNASGHLGASDGAGSGQGNHLSFPIDERPVDKVGEERESDR